MPISIALRPDPAFNADRHTYQVNATSSEPDASGDNTTSITAPVQQQDAIFGNGFE
ncbi:MAG: hypothetical protein WCD66_05940 [Rhodanobacteraceae bacterium]